MERFWSPTIHPKLARHWKKEKNTVVVSKEKRTNPDSAEQTQEQDDLEAKHDFWSISASFIFRHHVQERQNCTCHKKTRFLSHSNVSMLSGEQTRHWTCCRNVKWITTGTFMVIGSNQGNGPLSPRSFYSMISTSRMHVVREEIDEDSSNVHVRKHVARNVVRYVKVISKKKKALDRKKAKLAKMHDCWKVFVTSIPKARNSIKFSKCAKEVGVTYGLCNAV